MTIHYHGTPITPITALYELAGRHFCVSHANPQDVARCHDIGQSVMLDNGAFSAWKRVTRPYVVPPPGKWGYRGVHKHNDGERRKKPFYARVKYQSQEFYSPTFAMPHQAAIAYDVLAKLLHGERAILNFPTGEEA